VALYSRLCAILGPSAKSQVSTNKITWL
jgi:hypothetical protein